MVTHLIAVLMLITVGTPAHAQSSHALVLEQNYQTCGTHGGVHWFAYSNPIVKDVASCRANCFQYKVFCKDQASFTLTSRYDMHASDSDIFWYESFGALKFLIVAVLVFYAMVASFGTKDPSVRAHGAAGNALCVALVAFDIWTWGAVAVGISDALAFYSLPGALIRYIVFPLFAIARAQAFLRGCNYLFVRHPASSIVSPALRSQASIDTRTLVQTLASGAADSGTAPAYHYENQTEKARSLRDELQAKAAAAEAQTKIELRRAELAEAKRRLEEAKWRSERKR